MDSCVLDPQEWAQRQFGACDFGDRRLTRRLVHFAAAAAIRPNESTPQQTRVWSDCKGIYRFMDNEKVTFEEIIAPHCRLTKECAQSGVWLSICDTTELSFDWKRTIGGLGPTGDGGGQGFFLHSSMFVSDESDEIVGLGAQELFYRKPKPPNDTSAKRKKRKRESEVWGRVADQVGHPAPGAQIIHICDRGADDFEFYCHCLLNRCGWVVRAQHVKRTIHAFDPQHPDAPQKGSRQSLNEFIGSLACEGTYELRLRASGEMKPRTAKIEVRFGGIWMPRPRVVSPWVKKNSPRFIRMSVVEVREVKAPKGVVPVRWVLLTDMMTSRFNDAWRVISRYEKRPLVEEYHKAAKTGCSIEQRQYQEAERQERVVGVLSVLAIRLVQMKTVARVEPDRPAHEVAPEEWVNALCANFSRVLPKQAKKWNPQTITVREFFRGVAMMGGFLARKSDGEPGWITIWRGVKELLIKVEARREMYLRCG